MTEEDRPSTEEVALSIIEGLLYSHSYEDYPWDSEQGVCMFCGGFVRHKRDCPYLLAIQFLDKRKEVVSRPNESTGI